MPGVPYRNPAGIVAIAAQGSVSNSAADTGIINQAIPANGLIAGGGVGQSYIAEVWGNTDNVVTATPVWNVWLKINSVKIVTLSWTMPATALTNQPYYARMMMTCRTTGATGTVIGAGYGHSAAPTFGAGDFAIVSNTATTTLDTTAAQTLTLGANWGTANASNIGRWDHASTALHTSGNL